MSQTTAIGIDRADARAGIIGPGLLVSSGQAFSEGGPAGSLISFSLVGIIVFFVMYAPFSFDHGQLLTL